MKKLVTIITLLLTLTSVSQELSVSEIRAEVDKINTGDLTHRIFDTNEIYEQTTDGGGSFEVWLDKGKIRKITQTIFLSNGQFITTLYLKNEQPILIAETEKHFQWNEDYSELEADSLETDYSELIYSYHWDNDPVKVETEGESLRAETICGISDYWGLLKTAKEVVE